MGYFAADMKHLIFIIFALTAITLPVDQFSKQHAREYYLLAEDASDSTIYQGRREELVNYGTNSLWFSVTKTYVRNHGASWGIWANMDREWRRPVILALGLVATMVLFFVATRILSSGYRLASYSICGVIAGSLGNMLDRVRLGYVVDFLTLKVGVGSSVAMIPSFNVADIIIVLSLICLIATVQMVPSPKALGG